ncbi:hypothetical protein SASPL_147161 [Salvia splendens]|uniref:Uncharacterized protein n=1 Tax=Salvia splendens TaxID=180675 RepID=A0A8X8WDH0_SALSN|nr:hypothetical protein SASPL_147161 [Salvia splendens]
MVLVRNILLIGYNPKGLPDKSDALLWDLIKREEIPTSLQKSCEAVDHAKRLKEDSMLLLRVLSYWSFGFFMVYELDDELWESGKIKSNSGEKELVLLSMKKLTNKKEGVALLPNMLKSVNGYAISYNAREVVLTKALLRLQRIKGMGYGSSAITYDNIMVLVRNILLIGYNPKGLPDKSDALLWDLIKREEIPTSLQNSCEVVDHAKRLKEDSMLLLRVLSYWSFGFFMNLPGWCLRDDELWESGKIKSNSGEKELVLLSMKKLTNKKEGVLTKALLHLQRIKGMGYGSSAITYDNIMVLVRNILLIGNNPKGLPDKSDALLWDLIKREEIPTSLQKSCEAVDHATRLKEDSMLLLRVLSYWSFGFFMVYELDDELWESGKIKSNSGEKELVLLSEKAEAEQHAREEETTAQSRTCPRSHDVQKLTKTREVVLTKALLHLQRIKGMGYGSSAITYDNIMVLYRKAECRTFLIGYYQKGLSDKSDALLWDIINREEIPTSLQKSCDSVAHAKRLKEDSMLLLRVLSYWLFGFFMVYELGAGWCLRDDELWESGKIKSNSGEKELVLLSMKKLTNKKEGVALLPNMLKSVNGYAISYNAREVVLTKALLRLQRIKGMGYGSSAITYDNIMVLVRNILLIGYNPKGLPDKSDALLWDLIKREEIPTSLQNSCEVVDHAKRLKEDSMLLLRVLSYWSFGFFMNLPGWCLRDDELWESGKIKSNSGEKELVLLSMKKLTNKKEGVLTKALLHLQRIKGMGYGSSAITYDNIMVLYRKAGQKRLNDKVVGFTEISPVKLGQLEEAKAGLPDKSDALLWDLIKREEIPTSLQKSCEAVDHATRLKEDSMLLLRVLSYWSFGFFMVYELGCVSSFDFHLFTAFVAFYKNFALTALSLQRMAALYFCQSIHLTMSSYMGMIKKKLLDTHCLSAVADAACNAMIADVSGHAAYMLKSVNGYAISFHARDVVLTKALLHLQRIKGMGYSSSAITYDNIMVLVRNILLIGYNPKGLPDKSDALLWDLIKREEIPTSLQKSCEAVDHAKRLKEDSMLLLRVLSYWSFGFFMVYELDDELWESGKIKSNSGEKELVLLSMKKLTNKKEEMSVALLPNMLKSVNGYAISYNAREVVLTKALLRLQRIKGMGYGSSAITYDNIMVLVRNILLIGYNPKGLPDKSDALLWDLIKREEIPTSLQNSCEVVDHAKRLKEDSMLLLRVLSYWSFGFFMNLPGWCLRDDELWESGKIKSNSGEKELVLLSMKKLTNKKEGVLTKALLHLQRIKGMGYGSSAITYDNIMVLVRNILLIGNNPKGLPDKSDALLWDLIKREEIPTSLQKSCEAVDHATRLKEDSMLLLRVLSYWSFGFFMVYELDDELWESGKIKSNSGEKELVLLSERAEAEQHAREEETTAQSRTCPRSHDVQKLTKTREVVLTKALLHLQRIKGMGYGSSAITYDNIMVLYRKAECRTFLIGYYQKGLSDKSDALLWDIINREEIPTSLQKSCDSVAHAKRLKEDSMLLLRVLSYWLFGFFMVYELGAGWCLRDDELWESGKIKSNSGEKELVLLSVVTVPTQDLPTNPQILD